MIRRCFFSCFFIFISSTFFSCLAPTPTPGTPPIEKNQEIKNPAPLFEKTFSGNFAVPLNFDFNGRVSQWSHFAQAAASITLDDGTYDQYSTAWPILDEKGVKGTFYLAAGLIGQGDWDDHGTLRRMMDWNQAARIAAAGHEIGSHSLNHVDLTGPNVDLQLELRESRLLIESKLPGVKVETFCWPHWRETKETIAAARREYISARSGNGIISYYYNRKGGIPSDPPVEMYAVNALGILKDQRDSQWQLVADNVYNAGSWFVTSFHGLKETDKQEETGWSALDSETFREIIQYIKDKGFWIDTFASVSKYIYERDASTLKISNKGRKVTALLDDSLDDDVYNEPLSLSIEIPPNWERAIVFNESGDEISSSRKKDKLFFQLVPSGAPVFIKPY